MNHLVLQAGLNTAEEENRCNFLVRELLDSGFIVAYHENTLDCVNYFIVI